METTGSTKSNDELVIPYLVLRKTIGWLGMLLPFALLFSNWVINQLDILNNSALVQTTCGAPYQNAGSWKRSISHYYYSTVGELFTGTLCAVALFMFAYVGHPKRPGEKGLSDNAMANLAGIFALGVVIFPTSAHACITDNIRSFLSSTLTGVIHFIMAGSFFVTLAIMSLVNFRRTGDQSQFGKKDFHKVYRFCGWGMITCLGLIFVYGKWLEGRYDWLDRWNPIFCLELAALVLFGISWLTKGRVDYLFLPKKLKLMRG